MEEEEEDEKGLNRRGNEDMEGENMEEKREGEMEEWKGREGK